MTKLTRHDLDAHITERHDATRELLAHLERSPSPRVPRGRGGAIHPRTPPGGTVISLRAYHRHAAIVAAALVGAAGLVLAWWLA